uniref:Uncharacterized protein n=1 Tax=Arundo donax TaxID=35708 RepID=A0A0A8YXM9_ARUDO
MDSGSMGCYQCLIQFCLSVKWLYDIL